VSSATPVNTESAALPSEALQLGRKHEVRELVVVSGKGGTGKTSIVASLCALAEQAVVADCDVDAADLHLLLAPVVLRRSSFSGGKTAVVDVERCIDCGACVHRCRFGAIQTTKFEGAAIYEVNPTSCEGCGVCVDICSESAVSLVAVPNGEWYVSTTRHGPLVHARLGIAQENSGKLVSLVRREAKAICMAQRRGLLICDGSPGIGCPVMASITGASLVLIVTEPTLSGFHDLKRIMELCRQFNVTVGVCINKADLNLAISLQVEEEARAQNVPVLGRIRYDESVTQAQIKRMSVVENGDSLAATDIRALWNCIRIMLA
jgi:MinD superfamily P-loop ATPase